MALPLAFIEHLRAAGYHPRSNKHSNALAHAIASDLASRCPKINDEAQRGRLVFDLNFDIHVQNTNWNIDLVLGPPPEDTMPNSSVIAQARPGSVRIALEFKAIMTEHGKARKNRKRDLEAHQTHVHAYDPKAIAGGVFLVNQATTFQSPLRSGVTRHGSKGHTIQAIVEYTIAELRGVTERRQISESGLDAKCAIVVDMDNIDLSAAKFVQQRPAPLVGDPLNYDSFIQRVCSLYEERY